MHITSINQLSHESVKLIQDGLDISRARLEKTYKYISILLIVAKLVPLFLIILMINFKNININWTMSIVFSFVVVSAIAIVQRLVISKIDLVKIASLCEDELRKIK
jgi:hypothetical protein